MPKSLSPEERLTKKKTYARAYYLAHCDALRAKARAYRLAHLAKVTAREKAYKAAHRPEVNARARLWYAAHRERERVKRLAQRDEKNTKRRTRYAVNHEAALAKAQAYRAIHRAKIRAQRQAYRGLHGDEIRARDRVAKRTYRSQAKIYEGLRRARKKGVEATLTRKQWELIKASSGYRCAYCGKKSKRLEQDHVMPLSKGGAHAASNIVPACHVCNAKKHVGPPLCAVQPILPFAL